MARIWGDGIPFFSNARIEPEQLHTLTETDTGMRWRKGSKTLEAAADRLFNLATHSCRWLDGLGGGLAAPYGPYLRGLRFRDGLPRPCFSVIVTPPIGRTHNEQVWPQTDSPQAPWMRSLAVLLSMQDRQHFAR